MTVATTISEFTIEQESKGKSSWFIPFDETIPTSFVALIRYMGIGGRHNGLSSLTRIADPWSFSQDSQTVLPAAATQALLVSDLGWSTEEAAAIRMRLLPFAGDWDAPEMSAYDAL